MTVNDLVARTKQHVGYRSSTTIDDAWYLERVQSGYERLALFQGPVSAPGRGPRNRIIRFRELEDRVDRTISSALTENYLTLSTGAAVLLGIWDKDNNRRIPRRSSRLLHQKSPTETGSFIRMWAPGGQDSSSGYYIWPIPTSDVDISEWIYKQPETLTAGGSDPVIPSNWHPAIHLAAGAEAAELLALHEDADRLERQFLNFIATRKTPQEESRQTGGLRHMFIGRRWHHT